MTRNLRSLLIIIITLSIVMGGMSFGTGTASAQTSCTQTHTVGVGQNLFRIGLLYGKRWDVLQAWNNLANPNLIYVGQVLCVSGPWNGGYNPPTTPPTTPPTSPIVVRPGNPFGPTTEPRAYFPAITLGQKFELLGYNFPKNRTVTINLGVRGNPNTPYYTATTDANGEFYVEVAIPDALKTSSIIAVKVTTAGGYYALNWFYNR